MKRFVRSCLIVGGCFLVPLLLWGADWPNGPDEDPTLALPSDPSFARRCRCKPGVTCPDDDPDTKENKEKACFHDRHCGGKNFSCQGRGQWNFWSLVPEEWAKNPGFRQEEIRMGTGMHFDRAWQVTPGDPKVVIAVLDSGIYWDNKDLVNKFYLNPGELPFPQDKDGKPFDKHDVNGDGVFNVLDYKDDPRVKDTNANGFLDPEDLLAAFSNGKDDDSNGYVDDISGWDFMWNDNNARDDTRHGHGNGQATGAAAEGNNALDRIGGCPKCMILPLRVSDSFIGDTNHYAAAVVYATDMKAQVINEALGVVNNTSYARDATAYAWKKGTIIIASSADETSFHHNYPGNYLHNIYVHAIRYDDESVEKATTFLNFTNCSNFGAKLTISTPAISCSSEATELSSGHAGLIVSAALKFALEPPLTPAEIFQIFVRSADDINVPGSASDPTKYPSGLGWDFHFGYGRNNVRNSVDFVRTKAIPPSALIVEPKWYQPIYPDKTPSIDVVIEASASRHKSFDYVLEVGKGVQPKDSEFKVIKEEKDLAGSKNLTIPWSVKDESFEQDGPKGDDSHRHSYTLRVRITAFREDGSQDRGEFRKSVHLLRDPDLLAGFPKYMGAGGAPSPKMADLNGDGKMELILATEDGYIHALGVDGKDLVGWPVKTEQVAWFDPKNPKNFLKAPAYQTKAIRSDVWQSILGTPAVGDLDGDGKLEVVAATIDGNVHAFLHDGRARAGFPVRLKPELSKDTSKEATLEYGIFGAPVLYDIDGDGKLEIIVAAMDSHVYVWRHDGTPQPGFPVLVMDKREAKPQKSRLIGTPAVGDVDGDGKAEIFVGSTEIYLNNKEARVYGIQSKGNDHPGGAFLPGWPVKVPALEGDVLPFIGRGHPNSPALADFDGDGKLEIVVTGMFFFPTVYKADGTEFLNADGSNFGAGSNSKEKQMFFGINNIALADLNGDRRPEMIGGGLGSSVIQNADQGGKRTSFEHLLGVWDGQDGVFLPGFPRKTEDYQFFNNPIVVDISGDNKPDILWGSGGYLLHAVDASGRPLEGWPKHTGGWIVASAVTGDMTGDGKREVAVITRNGWLFVWKTKGDASIRAWWESYHHDLRNTGNLATPLPGRDPNAAPPEINPEVTKPDAGQPEAKPVGGCGCTSDASSSLPFGAFFLLLFLFSRLLRGRKLRRLR